VALKGEDISCVDHNQWFINLLQDFPGKEIELYHEGQAGPRRKSNLFHLLVAAQVNEKDREIDDLRRKNRQKLVGAAAHLSFSMEQDYNTTFKSAKDAQTTVELKKLTAQYEELENEVANASEKGKSAAKEKQFIFYREHMWPTIKPDFLRDPSSQAELPTAGDYAGLISILPSGHLVESTALMVSYFLLHSPELKLALFFTGAPPRGNKGLPSTKSPLAGRVFVKGKGIGKLVQKTSQEFETLSRSSAGREDEYEVLLLDEGLERTTVTAKGIDIELQRIPEPLRILQALVPELDDAAIESSVELYWHEKKGKAIMRGQLVEDKMDKVSAVY
jgi:hypothetical protein